MKITFVAIGVESHAIEIISSFLKSKGHQTKLVFDPSLFASETIISNKIANMFDTRQEIAKQVINSNPDMVGFSVFTINYQRAISIAKLIKKLKPDLPIIFGGIHPTCVPEIVIKQKVVDIVCVGEGEYALLELLNSPKRTNIKNLWFKKNKKIIKNPLRPLIKNLDRLPFPDKDMFYKIYPGFLKDYYTTSSRGCPFGCTFCANNVLNKIQAGLGPTLRRRSPQNMIDELIWAKKRYKPKKITFVDDIFVQNVNWLNKFSKLYQKHIKLPYVVLTHPKFVTKKIAYLLKKSGCYFLLFGIQSPSEKIRSKILKRYESNQEIEQAATNCHQVNLPFSIDHIFNIPGETIKEYVEGIKFYSNLKPTIINTFWLQYFPKTDIITTAIKYKYLSKKIVPKINQGKTSTSVVVGFGGSNTGDPRLIYKNFQFIYLILPILPPWALDIIIDNKLYLKKFHPSFLLNTLIKISLSLRVKRGGVYFGIIKSTLFFMFYNLKLKHSKKYNTCQLKNLK